MPQLVECSNGSVGEYSQRHVLHDLVGWGEVLLWVVRQVKVCVHGQVTATHCHKPQCAIKKGVQCSDIKQSSTKHALVHLPLPPLHSLDAAVRVKGHRFCPRVPQISTHTCTHTPNFTHRCISFCFLSIPLLGRRRGTVLCLLCC